MGALTHYQNGASLLAGTADWADRDGDDEMGTVYTLSKGILLVPGSQDPEPPARRLTRRVRVKPARVFRPIDPALTPEEHFPLQTVTAMSPYPRFVSRYNSREMLLVVEGSCTNNGGHGPQAGPPTAGASFMFKGGSTGTTTTMPFLKQGKGCTHISGTIAFRLERQGPRNDGAVAHTSNRAKLRAVIAALEFRNWHAEGWRRVVVVTDLEYVVHGATRWVPTWTRRRWRNKKGAPVANRDLWEQLQARVDAMRAGGAEVAFWLLPPRSVVRAQSELMREAKAAAQDAARTEGPLEKEFTRLCGIFV